jgi:hypothetical protein
VYQSTHRWPLWLTFPRPPRRWGIARRYLRLPQRDQMAALVWIAPERRALLTSHVALQFMDGGRFRSADDVQSHRLVRIAAKAADLKIEVSGVQCVAQSRRWLCRSLVPEHALVPSLAGQPVRFLPGGRCTFGRMPDRTSVDTLARFSAHASRMRRAGRDRQAATDWARNRSGPLLVADVEKAAPKGTPSRKTDSRAEASDVLTRAADLLDGRRTGAAGTGRTCPARWRHWWRTGAEPIPHRWGTGGPHRAGRSRGAPSLRLDRRRDRGRG